MGTVQITILKIYLSHQIVKSIQLNSLSNVMAGDSESPDTYCVNFQGIFHTECANHENYFSDNDDTRKRLYLLLSNSKTLAEKCTKLTKDLISFTKNTIISVPQKERTMDLLNILRSKTEGITPFSEEYQHKKLNPPIVHKLHAPLFPEIILSVNNSKQTNTKSKVNACAYVEARDVNIGYQHVMYTTQPGSKSDSSSVDDFLDDTSSNSSPTSKRRKTCQKAGEFQLGVHRSNSSFNNAVKCQVEIFILIGKSDFCSMLANHLGIISLETLLGEEDRLLARLENFQNKIFRLTHTEIIKKMMEGYSSICVTTSIPAWQLIPAHMKAVIFTVDQEDTLGILDEANYSLCVENNILAHIEAIGQVIQKSLLCNVLIETKYEVAKKVYTEVKLPMTVLLPLYIMRYFSQSYLVSHGHCSNNNPEDIFESPDC